MTSGQGPEEANPPPSHPSPQPQPRKQELGGWWSPDSGGRSQCQGLGSHTRRVPQAVRTEHSCRSPWGMQPRGLGEHCPPIPGTHRFSVGAGGSGGAYVPITLRQELKQNPPLKWAGQRQGGGREERSTSPCGWLPRGLSDDAPAAAWTKEEVGVRGLSGGSRQTWEAAPKPRLSAHDSLLLKKSPKPRTRHRGRVGQARPLPAPYCKNAAGAVPTASALSRGAAGGKGWWWPWPPGLPATHHHGLLGC